MKRIYFASFLFFLSLFFASLAVQAMEANDETSTSLVHRKASSLHPLENTPFVKPPLEKSAQRVSKSKREVALLINQGNDVFYLISAVKHSKMSGFDDLTLRGKEKLIRTYRKNPSFYRLLGYCRSLFEIKEGDCALKLCGIAFESLQLHQFPQFLEIIMMLKEKEEDGVIKKGLKQAIQVCKPRDMTAALAGQTLGFYKSSVFLLMISALSQQFEYSDFSKHAADNAIGCTLADAYNKSEELADALENLAVSFKRLQLPELVTKVDYYLSEFNSPSLSQTPSISPKKFDIYWVNLKGTVGAEIKKPRPYIVISKTSPYNNENMVTVIPLSTKQRRATTSIPLYFSGKDQEARLDQIKSIDTSRLETQLGILPRPYQAQLMLALKHLPDLQ